MSGYSPLFLGDGDRPKRKISFFPEPMGIWRSQTTITMNHPKPLRKSLAQANQLHDKVEDPQLDHLLMFGGYPNRVLFAAFCGKMIDPLVVKDSFLRGSPTFSQEVAKENTPVSKPLVPGRPGHEQGVLSE